MQARVQGDSPALRRGLAIVPVDNGLIVEGGPRRQRFEGAAATDLLPRLLPLLDGSSTRSELMEQAGLPEHHLAQVLDLLAARGLLESGTGDEGDATDEYLSRTLPVGSIYRSGRSLRQHLNEQTVLIAAPAPLRDGIAADLEDSGIGSVGPFDERIPPDCSLVVVCDDGELLERVIERCAPHGIAVLRCGSAGGFAEIGPKFLAGRTPCVDCFRRGYAGAFPVRPTAEPASLAMLAALVTGEVLATFHVGTAAAPHLMCRIDTAELSDDRYVVAPEAECPNCGVAGRPHEAVAETFGHYEWQVQASPADPALLGDSPAPTADQRYYLTDYKTSPRRKLSELPEGGLSSLLAWTVGFRDDGSGRRWPPTGGNLGSVELFVLTDRAWTDFPGTVFKYNPAEEELVAARSDRVPLSSMLAGTGLPTRDLYAAVVFCGALWRLAPKYGLFAPRLTHLDAGCASAQFALHAEQEGFDVRFAHGWTGQLAKSLELVGRREIVTAVAGVYRKEPADADHTRG
jgi:hypothetical protein